MIHLWNFLHKIRYWNKELQDPLDPHLHWYSRCTRQFQSLFSVLFYAKQGKKFCFQQLPQTNRQAHRTKNSERREVCCVFHFQREICGWTFHSKNILRQPRYFPIPQKLSFLHQFCPQNSMLRLLSCPKTVICSSHSTFHLCNFPQEFPQKA